MKALQFTVYEVLGYLIPGSVALAGLLLVAVSLLEPRLTAVACAGPRVLVGMAVLAYILGHCTQAIANLAFGWRNTDSQAVMEVPESIRSGLLQRFANALGKPLPETSLYDACDALVTQSGNTTLRDVYIYREGFYRGLTIALPILGVGVVCCWARWTWAFAAPSNSSFALTLVLALGAAVLTHRRFTRFARYRVRNSIFAATAYFISKDKETA